MPTQNKRVFYIKASQLVTMTLNSIFSLNNSIYSSKSLVIETMKHVNLRGTFRKPV